MEIDIELLLEGVYRRSGFDFRQYAFDSLQRRIEQALIDEGLHTAIELLDLVLHDARAMDRLLRVLSVCTTALFRDPPFFLMLREHILPALQDESFLRIWVAGCSTGEEAYSLAILLREEGLTGKYRIYATDMNESLLEQAKLGLLPLANMQQFTRNYFLAGGIGEFSRYYHTHADEVLLEPSLLEPIVFAQHNLATDHSFNEFHLILCRNVMIYFNSQLQYDVQRLLFDSLSEGGYLGLGWQETLHFSPYASFYRELEKGMGWYQRVRVDRPQCSTH